MKELVTSTKEGQLMTFNLIGNRVFKPLTSLPLDYRDQSEDFVDTKKATLKLENKLRNSPINHYYIDKGMTFNNQLFSKLFIQKKIVATLSVDMRREVWLSFVLNSMRVYYLHNN